MASNPLGDEGLDMRRQVAEDLRPSPPSELAERERHRDATPDVLVLSLPLSTSQAR